MRCNVENNFCEALPNFDYAAQLDPYNGRILHALGTTYYHLDIQDESQKTLQRTKYYFNDRNIYRNLGLSYMQSGNYQEAEKIIRKRKKNLNMPFILIQNLPKLILI